VAGAIKGLGDARAVILVEGRSDQAAVLALAGRQGRDLARERVEVVAMGGATNAGFFLEALGPHGASLPLAGLCDAAEVGHFLRGLARSGLEPADSQDDMEARGFFVCNPDLEGELIRAHGAASIERIFAAHGELGAFRTFQRQPWHRLRPIEQQMRRFLGTRATRKVRYGALLVEDLARDLMPRPLVAVLDHV
jgi:hypothetical protein